MKQRTLYLWHIGYDKRTGHKFLTGDRSDLWGVCGSNTGLDINELIICIQDDSLELNGPQYASLVGEAKDRGIDCVALLGMSQVDADKNYMRLINAIAAYNAKYPAGAFTGVSFDTEPWTNPNTGNANYLAYAAAVQWFRPILPGLKFYCYDDTWPTANPTDDNKVSQATYEIFAKAFDEVDIQSYGTDYGKIVTKASGGLINTRAQILNSLNIPFRILIETDPTAPASAQISNKTLPYLKELLAQLDALYRPNYPMYKGVCLHAWNGIFKIVGKVTETVPSEDTVVPPVVTLPEPTELEAVIHDLTVVVGKVAALERKVNGMDTIQFEHAADIDTLEAKLSKVKEVL